MNSRYACLLLSLACFLSQPPASAQQLEEIVVTAQRRAESLQDVPITINALSGEQLSSSGIEYTTDLQFHVPGFVLSPNAQFGLPFLRGVGTDQITVGLEGSVAVHSNGVYLPRLVSSITDFYDIERVEVIKGPQGTLFGRNATGGVINVTPRQPEEEFGGYIDFSAGNYETLRASGAVNVPLAEDRALLRIAALGSFDDGYVSNPYLNGRSEETDVVSLRPQLLLQVTDDLSIRLFGDYTKDESSRGQSAQLRPVYASNLGVAFGAPLHTGIRTQSGDASLQLDMEDYGFGAEITWDLGAMEFKSLSSYRKYEQTWALDFDVSELNLIFSAPSEGSESVLQEFQLASSGAGTLEWLVGAFLFFEEPEQDFRLLFGAAPLGGTSLAAGGLYDSGIADVTRVETEAYAVFGQFSYGFTEAWHATLGLRYSYEKKEVDYNFALLDIPAPSTAAELITNRPALGFSPFGDSPKNSWNALTPKFGIEYAMSEDILWFASATRGFKSGGFNSLLFGASPTLESVSEEFIWSYESGVKTTLMDGRLRANAAFFYYDYSDLQQNVLTEEAIAAGNGFANVRNVGDAEIWGLELELDLAATPHLFFDGQLAYLNTEIEQLQAPDPNDPADVDQDGNDLPKAPEFSVSMGAEYHLPLDGLGNLALRMEYSYRDRIYYTLFNDPLAAAGSHNIVNGRLSLNSRADKWSVAVYARNLLDEDYEVGGFRGGAFGNIAQFGRPRTYGVNLKYYF